MIKINKKCKAIATVFLFLIGIAVTINASDEDAYIPDSQHMSLNTNINDHNQENVSLLQGKYAVMTNRSPVPKTPIPNNDPQPTASFDNLPPQFNWMDYGGDWMSPVKDQGNCGSCWDFSALGTMEAAINIASGYPDTDVDLSEQYVLSCLPYGGSCNGGWTDDAFAAIISTDYSVGNGINGVPLESCMPYEANDNIPCSDKCDDWDTYNNPPQETDTLWQLESWGADHSLENDNPSDRDIVKSWIIDKGPLSASMYASGSFSNFWESHHSPDDWYFEEDHGYTNHAVVLLGWKDDPDVENGGYWILKNSWGTGWGYGGYFNAAYGGQDIGEIVRWCKAIDWPEVIKGAGPIDVDLAVFADFDFQTDEGTSYPHLGDEIEFRDTSNGDVAERAWDFNGDGVTDSTRKNPTWTYEAEGEYEVTLEIIGEWGLNSTRTKTVEVREIWPPIAVINPEEYIGNDIQVSFDGRYSEDRDGGQVVSYDWDFDDGGGATGGYVTHTFSEPDTIYEVSLTVTDDDGASETVTSTVKIDQTVPPVTEITHGFGCEDDLDWYGSTQRIAFEATDWTKVIDTFYRIDGAEWHRYDSSQQQFIPVSGDGMHTVEAYSIDFYGNEEIPVSETFGIDSKPPIVTIDVEGEMSNGWYDETVFVTLTGSDDLSGFDTCLYKIDGNNWMTYSNAFTISEGQHVLSVVGVDVAGNTMEEQMIINIDGGPPKSHVIFSGEGSNNVFYQSVEMRFAASDLGAGVQHIKYQMDNGGFKEYTDPIQVDEIGNHEVEFYAVDALGNQESIQEMSFEVSAVNFMMEVTQPDNALYIFGVELFQLDKPVIIGQVDVLVDCDSFTANPALIDYLEFFIDGTSAMIDSEAPFSWRLNHQMMGSHTLSVHAVSSNGEIVTKDIPLTCVIF